MREDARPALYPGPTQRHLHTRSCRERGRWCPVWREDAHPVFGSEPVAELKRHLHAHTTQVEGIGSMGPRIHVG